MVIQIRIPQNIINTCKENGWSELEAKEYFRAYMRDLMYDPYGQFEQDFADVMKIVLVLNRVL